MTVSDLPARLTRVKAAELLGVSDRRLDTMLRDGLLASLALPDVLEAAEQRWVTNRAVREILGVGKSRVGQLVESGRLPCYQARPGGRRWFRAGQVEVIANARESRKLR